MVRYKSYCSIKYLLLLIILWSIFSGDVSAKAWVVRKENKSSINQAIASASSYDTIFVYPGVWKEGNLLITKPLVLIGVKRPILDGELKCELITIRSSNVTIEGFDLKNSAHSSLNDYAGIKIVGVNNIVIRKNNLMNMFFGIYFQECNKSIADNNKLFSNGVQELQSGNGIHCWKCDSMIVLNNDIKGHRDGIYFEFVTNSQITGNYSHNNVRYGLHFMFSHHNDYTSNVFEKNGSGVAVMFTHHVKMVNNTFKDNWGGASYGILLKEISDSYIYNNIFSNNTAGIFMEGCNRTIVESNSFMNNGSALRIQANCDDNTVKGNNFMGNTFDVSTNGEVILNHFSNNYWDKYEGYDLNRDGIGDVPFHPVSMYAIIIDKIPAAAMFLRSFVVSLMDKSEKAIPSLTPEHFIDIAPQMRPNNL
jgi:nitrous oxidase accessory protein